MVRPRESWDGRYNGYRVVESSPAGPAHIRLVASIAPGAPMQHVGRQIAVPLDRGLLVLMLKSLDPTEE